MKLALRKILYPLGISAIVVVVIVVAVWIGLIKRYKAPSPMRCLPTETALVVRMADRATLIPQIEKLSYRSDLTSLVGGQRVWDFARDVDTLFAGNVVRDPALAERDVYISLSDSGVLSAAFCLQNRMEWHQTMRRLDRMPNVAVRDTSVGGYGLYLIDGQINGHRLLLYAAAGGGCLFCSLTPTLLIGFSDDAITPMHDDVAFSTIERTLSSRSPLSLYVNSRKNIFASDASQLAIAHRQSAAGSDWMALDLSPADNVLTTDGFKVAVRPTLDILLARHNSSPINLARRIPSGVVNFLRIAEDNRGLSSDGFSEYLSSSTDAVDYRMRQSEVFRRTGVDVEALLSQVFASEIALCQYPQGKVEKGSGRFVVVDTRGGTMAQATLTQALSALHNGRAPQVVEEISSGSEVVPQGVVSRRADAQMISKIAIPVYECFSKQDFTFFLPYLLGVDYPRRYFFRYEDALVFADDLPTLRRILIDYLMGHSMESSKLYKEMRTNFGTNSARFSYRRFAVGGNDSFGAIGIQTTTAGRLPYVSIAALCPMADETLQTNALWQVRLDTTLAGRPHAVDNHYTHSSECLVQDIENRLYLIGTDGMILWKRPIDGRIVGDVRQVDFYGNKKLQYLFSTESHLYIVDRLGNDVASFPVRLPSSATTGASVARYSDGSPLRFFVGCESGVVLYGPDGLRVDGWRPSSPEGTLRGTTEHFLCGGKDFIVSHDQYAYYFNDRQGRRRLSTEPLAPPLHSQMTLGGDGSYFLTASADGNVVSIDASSGRITRLVLDSIGSTAIGVPLPEKKAYLMADSRRVSIVDISSDTAVPATSFATDVAQVDQVETLDGMVAIRSKAENKVYIYRTDGLRWPRSPLAAHSPVAIGHIDGSLVVFALDESGALTCLGGQ